MAKPQTDLGQGGGSSVLGPGVTENHPPEAGRLLRGEAAHLNCEKGPAPGLGFRVRWWAGKDSDLGGN